MKMPRSSSSSSPPFLIILMMFHGRARRAAFFSLLLPIMFLVPGCSQPDHAAKLKPLVDTYVEYWNTGEFSGVEDILHPEFDLRMTPRFVAERGIESFKETVTKWRTAYPDFHIRIDELLFDENRAAARWTITATNTGSGWHPPTGKRVEVTGISIVHFKDGKIKDEWIAGNNGYWMHQLGFKFVSPFEGR